MRRGALHLPGAFARLVCAVLLLSARAARADEPPSAERLKSAAEEYDRGRRAFLADEFDSAAVHFENAYRDAPRAETLRLAIRARKNAKQPARAATLAAMAAERYPDDAATAQLAKETLDEAAPHLAELAITCSPSCGLTADGRVVKDEAPKHRLFLDPGAHELGVSFSGGAGSIARRVDAKKGVREVLSLSAPPKAAVVTPPPKVVPVVLPPVREGSNKPLPPVVFFIGVGITVGLGAATVVSGIDAKNHPGKDAVRTACAGKDASCPEYEDGKDAEKRTNILLGVTIGMAALTAVTGLFFTQWSSSVQVGAAPLPGGGAAMASGQF